MIDTVASNESSPVRTHVSFIWRLPLSSWDVAGPIATDQNGLNHFGTAAYGRNGSGISLHQARPIRLSKYKNDPENCTRDKRSAAGCHYA
jgi:hypothetical protein